ncbi:MAG: 50S ribosomal protein L29 [candidate division Zixibacteria bacterium]|nr:50S ribosomal protein L29 [candidate division Zixibacteria bacterium]
MKIGSLRELTRDELVQRRRDLEDELFNLNMRRSLKSLDNPLRLRTVRRDIARIQTVLHEDDRGIRSLAQSKTSVLGQATKPDTGTSAGE